MTTVIDSPDGLVALAGSSLGATPWQTISQEDVNTFGAVTRDEQWIHVDTERAQAGPFGGNDRARLPHAVVGGAVVR